MITLAIFRQMIADGVAGLTKDSDFFLEEAPLQHNGAPAKGVWLVTRGGDITQSRKGLNLRTTVDFYVAFSDKSKVGATHSEILDWMRENRSICALSGSVGEYSYSFKNIRIQPSQTPQNAGVTENELIIKVASAQLVYDLAN